MVNWRVICRPNDFGDLGVINTRLFNDCLLCKWIWKIDQAKDELWFRILKEKYFPKGDFKDSNPLKGSQFWKSLHKGKHLFFWGVNHKLGDGKSISF